MSNAKIFIKKMPPLGSLIDGEWLNSGSDFGVDDKFTGQRVATISAATREQVTRAVQVAKQAVERGAPPPHDRGVVLRRAAELLELNRASFVELMSCEAGFTLTDANAEIDRGKITLALCAEEATRLTGEVVPFAASPGAHKRIGFTQRFPVGVAAD